MNNQWMVGFFTSLGGAIAFSILAILCSTRLRHAIVRGILRLTSAGIYAYYPTQKAAGALLTTAFNNASNIRILAVRSWSLFPVVSEVTQLGDLVRSKKDKCSLRILLLSPFEDRIDGQPAFVKAREQELDKIQPRDAAGLALSKQIAMALDVIANLKKDGLNCSVRLYNELPVFKIFILDDIAFIGGFNRNNVGRNNPIYVVRRNEGLLFDLADRYFEYIWQHRAEDYDLDHPLKMEVKRA
jgi:hypothetical protein